MTSSKPYLPEALSPHIIILGAKTSTYVSEGRGDNSAPISIPQFIGQAPGERVIWLKMSIVLIFRNCGLRY